MGIRIGKTLPPAASPLGGAALLRGIRAILQGREAVERFERELQSSFRTRHCFAVSSGKAALTLILRAMQALEPQRDEVLVPAYACYSVPSAIVRAGLSVRMCDLAPDSLDYDYDRLQRELDNPRLLCVVCIHQFGVPADVERVRRMIGRRRVFIVEDAAQAMGAEWHGRTLATLGDAGLFSLGRGKALSAVEGGVILTGNDAIAALVTGYLSDLPNYGILRHVQMVAYAAALSLLVHPRLYWLPRALPFLKLGETIYDPSFPIRRLSPFQAGLADRFSERLDRLKRIRRRNANGIAGSGIACFGSRELLPDLIRFPVVMGSRACRDTLLEAGERSGLGIAPGYPDTVDGIAEMGGAAVAGESCPVAKDLAARLVTLPVHPYVGQREIDAIVKLFHRSRAGSCAAARGDQKSGNYHFEPTAQDTRIL